MPLFSNPFLFPPHNLLTGMRCKTSPGCCPLYSQITGFLSEAQFLYYFSGVGHQSRGLTPARARVYGTARKELNRTLQPALVSPGRREPQPIPTSWAICSATFLQTVISFAQLRKLFGASNMAQSVVFTWHDQALDPTLTLALRGRKLEDLKSRVSFSYSMKFEARLKYVRPV